MPEARKHMRKKKKDEIGMCQRQENTCKKGNLFKVVLGLQTALKIRISPAVPHVYVKASVGIFGQQAIPTALTVCVWWPFAIPQLWGMIQQNKLDKLVMDKIQNEFNRLARYPVVSRNID